MHELSITQGILQIALDAAAKADAKSITAIHLVIGDLSSLVDDSVQFYFDILGRDTPAQGAALRFQREPGTMRCWDCGQQTEARPPLASTCPACGGTRLQVTGGRELRVESIEIK